MLLSEIDIFTRVAANELLENRSHNEAYCTYAGGTCVVFFPDGGDLRLKLSPGAEVASPVTVRWLDILVSV